MSRYDPNGIDGYSEMLFALKEKSIFKCECGEVIMAVMACYECPSCKKRNPSAVHEMAELIIKCHLIESVIEGMNEQKEELMGEYRKTYYSLSPEEQNLVMREAGVFPIPKKDLLARINKPRTIHDGDES